MSVAPDDNHLTCSECGAAELWAWYRVDERQTIEAWLDSQGELAMNYTGSTKSGDAGEDDEYFCGNCQRITETLEEMVGLPIPRLQLSDSAALDQLNTMLSASTWPGASGLEDVCAVVRRTGRKEIADAPEWERH